MMTKKRCHSCGEVINDIMYWDNGIWCYCLDCCNEIVKKVYGGVELNDGKTI